MTVGLSSHGSGSQRSSVSTEDDQMDDFDDNVDDWKQSIQTQN